MSKYLEALRAQRAALVESRDAALAALDEITTVAEERDDKQFTDEELAGIEEHRGVVLDVKRQLDGVDDEQGLDARIAELETELGRADYVAKGVNFTSKPEPSTAVDVRSMSRAAVQDAADRIIDEATYVSDDQRAAVTKAIKRRDPFGKTDGDPLARRLVATESEHYRQAFHKGMTGRADEMLDDERRALSEVRAMSQTTTAGGFAMPVLIDPTVLITDGTGLTGLLPYLRRETITSSSWKGVSAGHTAWSFDAEAAEVSDDTSTFAQPEVPAETARGFIPFSLEIEGDFPNFASEMSHLLADGYMDLVAENLAVGAGAGSNAPWGVFITTTTTLDVLTDNVFQALDIDRTWAALGERFRAKSTWFMNVDVENDIRGFGSGTATSRFTVDQTREGISLLNGRPVVLSDWAPTWAGTDAAKILALGDFSQYLFAQRAGMTVEYVPHLTSTGNNLPSGQRGWFAWARYGHDKVVQNAFRVLKNQTSG